MGIFIYLSISDSITREEWKKAYEESLKLVQAFPFYELLEENFYGEQMYCAVPTIERERYGETGWHTIGDYETLKGAEDYFLPRELTDREEEGEYTDSLMGIVSAFSQIDWEDERCSHCYQLWGNKTQGEPYHMYLLAVACMLEARLGEKLSVYGDITRGQCLKAVKLANQYLDESIEPPVRCDADRFYKRVRKLPLDTGEVLDVFIHCFLGTKDAGFGEFIRKHFTENEIESYWKERFGNTEIGTLGFDKAVHSYLVLGFSLEDLCEYMQLSVRKGKKDYGYFVELIMQSSMHIREKDCGDCLTIDPESDRPYSIYTLMAQFFFAGAENKKVNRYMPLDDIRKILKKHLGEQCDIDLIVTQNLEKQEKKNTEDDTETLQDPSGTLNEFMEIQEERLRMESEQYDVSEYDELIYYETGDLIQPAIEKSLLKSYEFYSNIIREDRFAELMGQSPQDRCRYLIRNNRSITLRAEDWNHIFTDIETRKDSFERYYPMVRVQINTEDIMDMVRSIVLNDDLFQYCKEKIR